MDSLQRRSQGSSHPRFRPKWGSWSPALEYRFGVKPGHVLSHEYLRLRRRLAVGSLQACYFCRNVGDDPLQASFAMPEAAKDSLAEVSVLRGRPASERSTISPGSRDNDPVIGFQFAQQRTGKAG